MLTNYLPNSAHPASLAPPGYEPVSAGALRDASLFQHITSDSSQLKKDGYITEEMTYPQLPSLKVTTQTPHLILHPDLSSF